MIVWVPVVAVPMVIELKPADKAVISAVVICSVPAAPPTPMEVETVEGCKIKVLVPEILEAPPLNVMASPVNVKARVPAATVLPKVIVPVPVATLVTPPSVTATAEKFAFPVPALPLVLYVPFKVTAVSEL
jgi:hypothetical protein